MMKLRFRPARQLFKQFDVTVYSQRKCVQGSVSGRARAIGASFSQMIRSNWATVVNVADASDEYRAKHLMPSLPKGRGMAGRGREGVAFIRCIKLK